jgi:hypothetical protein
MEEATTAPTLMEPAIDLDANPLAGQVASAVLDLKGDLVRGKLSKLSQTTASILFGRMQETGQLNLQDDPVQRITVALSSSRYVVARDENHVYIAQLRLV